METLILKKYKNYFGYKKTNFENIILIKLIMTNVCLTNDILTNVNLTNVILTNGTLVNDIQHDIKTYNTQNNDN